ncbi:MAG: carbohydrate ABC transporter permease [Clostridia bacterium]|nr:carbohydrate ABC transporter permease [Clostridia bacterium]
MQKKKIRISDVVTYVILFAFAFIVIAPLFLMVITSLKKTLEFMKFPLDLPKEICLDGFKTVFLEHNFMMYLGNSVFVSLISLAVSLVMALALAYALGRNKGKWVRRLYVYFLAGMIVPIRLGVLFLNDMLNSLHLLNTHWGLICIYTAMSIPFGMYILTGYVKMIPAEIDEAATIDGCTTIGVIGRIILPLIRPALATVAIYNFLPIWNDVYFPLVFIFDETKKTFMLHVTMFFGQYSKDYNLIFSALTFAAGVSLIFYVFASRQLIKGLTAGALKG